MLATAGADGASLRPARRDAFVDPAAEAEVGWLVDLVTEIRQLRAEMNVPDKALPELAIVQPDLGVTERLARVHSLISALSKTGDLTISQAAPAGAVTFVVRGTTAALSLAGIIDLSAERARLTKAIAAFDSDIGHVMKKLGNENFIARAAPDVIDQQRDKLAECEAGKAKLQAALDRLDSIEPR